MNFEKLRSQKWLFHRFAKRFFQNFAKSKTSKTFSFLTSHQLKAFMSAETTRLIWRGSAQRTTQVLPETPPSANAELPPTPPTTVAQLVEDACKKLSATPNAHFGWCTIKAALAADYKFPEIFDTEIPQKPVNYCNIVILGFDRSGRILFCYNAASNGRDFYRDCACAMVSQITQSVPALRLHTVTTPLPMPLQAVQFRFLQSAVASQEPLTMTTNFNGVTFRVCDFTHPISIIAPSHFDLTKAPQGLAIIPKLLRFFLEPITLNSLPPLKQRYTIHGGDTITRNVIAHFRFEPVCDAVFLSDPKGDWELTTELPTKASPNQWKDLLQEADSGVALFTGVTINMSQFGYFLQWGGINTFFTPLADTSAESLSRYGIEPFQTCSKRADFGDIPNGFNEVDPLEYRPNGYYTITDLVLVHAHRIRSHIGGKPAEEIYFVTDTVQDPSRPLFLIRVLVYQPNQFLLHGTEVELPEPRRGEIYTACNLIMKSAFTFNVPYTKLHSIQELQLNVSHVKQRLVKISNSDARNGFAHDFVSVVTIRKQMLDKTRNPDFTPGRRATPNNLVSPMATNPALLTPKVPSLDDIWPDLTIFKNPAVEPLPVTPDENAVMLSSQSEEQPKRKRRRASSETAEARPLQPAPGKASPSQPAPGKAKVKMPLLMPPAGPIPMKQRASTPNNPHPAPSSVAPIPPARVAAKTSNRR